ncbi:hypothetical protein GCM10009118_16040 [Wandonia haliotis]|uniref:Uncharacterized protein n=1 Tax=Wandonia haliotis TaxID=574963 RepID=A0ABN1MPK8_9FLAO
MIPQRRKYRPSEIKRPEIHGHSDDRHLADYFKMITFLNSWGWDFKIKRLQIKHFVLDEESPYPSINQVSEMINFNASTHRDLYTCHKITVLKVLGQSLVTDSVFFCREDISTPDINADDILINEEINELDLSLIRELIKRPYRYNGKTFYTSLRKVFTQQEFSVHELPDLHPETRPRGLF